ncbi:MAG: hypothetical protein AAFX95_23565 [Cyanobacteria bacterium J06639_16]
MKVIFPLRNIVLTAGLLGLVMVASCQRADQTAVSAPTDSVPADSVPVDSVPAADIVPATPEPPADSSPQTAPSEEAVPPPESSSPTPQPPNPPANASESAIPSQAALPDALVKTWEPLSSVLYGFGPMTITPTEIRWDDGQTSAYEVVSSSGGSYVLKLTAVPSFYDTPNPYLKLVPESGSQEVEAYFYETEAAADQDTYIMQGTYFVE